MFFRLKSEEVSEDWRKLHNGELQVLLSPNVESFKHGSSITSSETSLASCSV